MMRRKQWTHYLKVVPQRFRLRLHEIIAFLFFMHHYIHTYTRSDSEELDGGLGVR